MSRNRPAHAIQLCDVQLEREGGVVLRDVSFAAATGSITAILGPSGSGKSTLLSALTGELGPSIGSIDVLGDPVPAGQPRALLEFRKRMGVLLQGNGLLSDLTVAENIALPLMAHAHLPTPLLQRVIDLKLNAVGLRGAADLFPRELSGGMARRVALARALALDPPLMIYDEPLTGLDPIASGVILALIRRLNDSLGLTSIIVTHHVAQTLTIADAVIVIAHGTVVFDGNPADLQSTQDPLLLQFLRGHPDGPIGFDYA